MNKYAHLAPSMRQKRRAIFNAVRGGANSCIRKIRWETEEKANVAAGRSQLKFNKPFRSYLCSVCQGYHLTSQVDAP